MIKILRIASKIGRAAGLAAMVAGVVIQVGYDGHNVMLSPPVAWSIAAVFMAALCLDAVADHLAARQAKNG